jgi:regulatory protein
LKGSDRPDSVQAYQRALHLLARRDYSEADLKRKLAVRGFAPDSVSEAIERLAGQGLVDDGRFAAKWVESAVRSGRGYGPRLLMDLQRQGISRETAKEVVAAVAKEHGEREVLEAIVSRRFPSFDQLSATRKERQRLYAYLQRRGFSISAIAAFFNNDIYGQD